MRGRGKSSKKGKKSARAAVPAFQGARFQLNGEQAARIMQRVFQGGVLPMPQQVAAEDLPRATEAMLVQQMQAMADVVYGGVRHNAMDSPDLVTSTNSLRELTDELVDAYQAELPQYFGQKVEPSARALEAISHLKRVLQMGHEVKIRVSPATATCEELLHMPLNYPFSEILREFLHLHQFNIVCFQRQSRESDGEYIPEFYYLSLTQVDQFKKLFSEWITFIAPYWKLNKLLTDECNLVYQNGSLIVTNKNKALQIANGKEHPMIQIAVKDVPTSLPKFETLLKLMRIVRENSNVVALSILYNQLYVSSFMGDFNLGAFPFVAATTEKGVKFYTLPFEKLDLLDNETLARLATFMANTTRDVALIKAFTDKFFTAANLSYPVQFMLHNDDIHYDADERTDYVLLPLARVLDLKLDTVMHTVKFKVAALKACLDQDMSAVLAEVVRNEALFTCYETLRHRYGDRFMPKINYADLYAMKIDELKAKEQALILEDQAAAKRVVRLQSNTQILETILIHEYARGKQWQQTTTDLCIQPLSIPGQGILRLLNINGLVVDKANKGSARISLVDLQEIDTQTLTERAAFAKLMGGNLSLLDAMICRVCKSTTDRFTDTGVQFELTEACREIFAKACQPLYPLAKNGNGLYEIPYATCGRDELVLLLPKMRKELEAHFKPVPVVEIVKAPPQAKKVIEGHREKDHLEPKKKTRKNKVRAVPAAVPAAPKKKVERTGTIVKEQPAERARELPRPAQLDSHTLSVIANAAVQQHEFNVAKDKEKKVKIRNAHEGAILHELNALTQCALWSESMPVEVVRDVHQVTQLYSMELAMLRLMNAIYERRRDFPDCQQITTNDFEAAEVRAEIVHGLPTLACLLNLSDKIRNDFKLQQVATDIFAGKAVSVAKSRLSDFMKLFQHAPMHPEAIIQQTFTDLDMLMTFNSRNDGKPETVQNIQRAIKGCIVKLGELSGKVDQLFTQPVRTFLQECHQLRNVAVHNNVSANDFDPLPFEVAHQAAIQGLECWRSIVQVGSISCPN